MSSLSKDVVVYINPLLLYAPSSLDGTQTLMNIQSARESEPSPYALEVQ